MTLYQPVHLISDGYRIGQVASTSIYRTEKAAKLGLKRLRGFTLEEGEYRVGGFVQPVEYVSVRGCSSNGKSNERKLDGA